MLSTKAIQKHFSLVRGDCKTYIVLLIIKIYLFFFFCYAMMILK